MKKNAPKKKPGLTRGSGPATSRPKLKPTQKSGGPKAPVARVNWSTLKYLEISPKLMKFRADHPEEETPAKKLGTAIHCAILEPKEFPKRWLTADICAALKKDGARCSNQGALVDRKGSWYCKVHPHPKAAAPAPGIDLITPPERKVLEAVVAAVREHPVAARLLKNALVEQEVHWTHQETGIACRGRLDCIRPNEIVDLKTTREDTVRGIERDIANRLYYAQVAWYHDGAIAAKKLPADANLPLIIAASTCEPADVAVFRMRRVAYEAGQILYRDFLLQYQDCMRGNLWPGMAPRQLEYEPPPWARGMNGSEYERNDW